MAGAIQRAPVLQPSPLLEWQALPLTRRRLDRAVPYPYQIRPEQPTAPRRCRARHRGCKSKRIAYLHRRGDRAREARSARGCGSHLARRRSFWTAAAACWRGERRTRRAAGCDYTLDIQAARKDRCARLILRAACAPYQCPASSRAAGIVPLAAGLTGHF